MAPSPKVAKDGMDKRNTYAVALIVLVVVCLSGLRRSSSDVLEMDTVEFSHAGSKTTLPDDWEEWDSCVISKVDTPSSREPTKPFWFPHYPSSSPFTKKIVEQMATGGIVRNFYTKKCQPYGKTILCDQTHPMIPIKPLPEDSSRTKEFNPLIIIPIRNPMTAQPAFQQVKAELYHHQKGQVEEESWRRTRDQWYNGTFFEWVTMIETWKSMPYEVAMYLPYEHVMDPAKGPAVIKRLSGVLRNAGFPMKVADESVPCVWYQGVGKESLITHHDYGYHYTDYLPGYTPEQKEFYLKEFALLINKFADDSELVGILEEYRNEVQNHMRIDKPSSPLPAP